MVLHYSKTAASQLNALKRLRSYILEEKTRKILIQSFVLSHFNYCPLVWYFTTAKQLQKIERIQERALPCTTDEELLINTGMASMRVRPRSTEGSNVRPKSQNKNWWNLSSTLDDFCPH